MTVKRVQSLTDLGKLFFPTVLERILTLLLRCFELFQPTRISEPWSFPSGDMLDLLKWRAHPERISDSLSKLREIDGSEIVKVNSSLLFQADSDDTNYTCALFHQFLQDTLDTLFGILDESSQRYGLKVFDSLVSLWGVHQWRCHAPELSANPITLLRSDRWRSVSRRRLNPAPGVYRSSYPSLKIKSDKWTHLREKPVKDT